jgi:hypothetical protein
MKRLAVVAVIAGCLPRPVRIEATSDQVLAAADATMSIATTPLDAASLVIEKLGARGFTVIASRRVDAAVRLKLAGNRDFSGTHTLGSVFYVWLDPVPGGTKIRLLGKPTLDHDESCPTIDNEPTCTMLQTYVTWGLSGVEEARVIRGVFAEIQLYTEPVAPVAATEAPARSLSLHDNGNQLRLDDWRPR